MRGYEIMKPVVMAGALVLRIPMRGYEDLTTLCG